MSTDRAWVGRKHVMPITSKPEVKKRSQRWVQANEEMKEYQRQLALLYPDANKKVYDALQRCNFLSCPQRER